MTKPRCFAVLLVGIRAFTSLAARYSVGLEARAISGSGLTSIDWNYGAGNPRRFVGRKIQSHERDVFRLSKTPEWKFRDALLSRCFRVSRLRQRKECHLSLDDRRAHAVHTNVILRVVERHRSRQSGNPGFCRTISGALTAGYDSKVRADVDDRAAPGFPEGRN